MRPSERWELGLPHHPKSIAIKNMVDNLQRVENYGIQFGGDGDDGEVLLYILDAFFEYEDSRVCD